MGSRKIIIVALCLSATMLSCKKKESSCGDIPATKNNIQGKWYHNYGTLTESEKGFILPPKFSFRFINDSFYMMINQFSDIIADTNGCQYLDWKEYSMGTLQIENNKLFLQGVYADSAYKIKNGGCYNSGVFSDSFKANFCETTLVLNWLNAKASSIEKREIRLIKE